MFQNISWMVGAMVMLAISTSACKHTKPDVIPTTPINVDGHLPLKQAVRPVHYTLDIQIDPVSGLTQGTVVMSIDVKKPTDTVLFHAQDLDIKAAFTMPMTKALKPRQAGVLRAGKNGAMSVTFPRALTNGTHTVHMSWSAKIPTAPTGLYRLKEGNDWYAFTQFEPLEARRAFPCIDEPGYKTTYDVTLTVPKAHRAFANTPQKDRRVRAKSSTMMSYVFERSKPMPTYLVAFAVGPFDVIEQDTPLANQPPLRVIVPRGKGALAQYALKTTPAILKDLQDYFGQPYPYAKLDVVAVPNFAAGAMENIGLVTFREQLLLLDEARATAGQKYSLRSIMAHELAHMWFGNYVTPAWWNDLWLNESFATWMASEVMVRTAPEFDPSLRQVRGIAGLMGRDSLPKTRAIRQPITHGGDIYNAFDGMTYAKGAALLRMTESWIGPKAFQSAIRAYMKQHAHGNATAEDLMKAFQGASGQDVNTTISTFLEQPGVPMFDVEMACQGTTHTVTMAQTRYTPKGVTLPKTTPWRVPVCFSLIKSGKRTRHCSVVTKPSATLTLPGNQCYDLVYPNADARGYYLWRLKTTQAWAPYTSNSKDLTMRERLALYEQLNALSQSDSTILPAYYELAYNWAQSTDIKLFERATGTVTGMERVAREEGKLPQFKRIIYTLYQPQLKSLGLDPAPKEPMAKRRARRAVIGALGLIDDPYILANAQGVMSHFLKDANTVPAHRASWALPMAARAGDATLWDALVNIVKTTKNPRARQQAIAALGAFRDPDLLKKSWQLLLDGTLRSSEMWRVLGPSFGHKSSYRMMWTWLKTSYDPLTKKLGPLAGRSMPWLASGFCKKEDKAKIMAFFEPKLKTNKGMARNYTNVLASIDRCITWRATTTPIILKTLEKYGSAPTP